MKNKVSFCSIDKSYTDKIIGFRILAKDIINYTIMNKYNLYEEESDKILKELDVKIDNYLSKFE